MRCGEIVFELRGFECYKKRETRDRQLAANGNKRMIRFYNAAHQHKAYLNSRHIRAVSWNICSVEGGKLIHVALLTCLSYDSSYDPARATFRYDPSYDPGAKAKQAV